MSRLTQARTGDAVSTDVQVVAGMPDYVQEALKIKVAHFEPVTVSLVGQGVYPALSLNLPRSRNGDYDQAVIDAQDSLRAAQLRPQPILRYALLMCNTNQVLAAWHFTKLSRTLHTGTEY